MLKDKRNTSLKHSVTMNGDSEKSSRRHPVSIGKQRGIVAAFIGWNQVYSFRRKLEPELEVRPPERKTSIASLYLQQYRAEIE
jgi:hypothetical protein